MSAPSSSLSAGVRAKDRFQAMPRVVRWLVYAAIGLVLFFIWDGLIQPVAEDLNKASGQIESDVAEILRSKADLDKLKAMKETVTSLGPVATPTGSAEGDRTVAELVNQVLQKNGATNYSFDLQPRGTLPKASLTSVVQGDRRVERLSGDLKFDATPQATVAILAELESSPDVELVNSVRIIRDSGGKVKVHLTIEAWVLAAKAAPQGAIS